MPTIEDVETNETRPTLSSKMNKTPLKSLRLTEESVNSLRSFRTQSIAAVESDLSYRYPTIEVLREDEKIVADIEGNPKLVYDIKKSVPELPASDAV